MKSLKTFIFCEEEDFADQVQGNEQAIPGKSLVFSKVKLAETLINIRANQNL